MRDTAIDGLLTLGQRNTHAWLSRNSLRVIASTQAYSRSEFGQGYGYMWWTGPIDCFTAKRRAKVRTACALAPTAVPPLCEGTKPKQPAKPSHVVNGRQGSRDGCCLAVVSYGSKIQVFRWPRARRPSTAVSRIVSCTRRNSLRPRYHLCRPAVPRFPSCHRFFDQHG